MMGISFVSETLIVCFTIILLLSGISNAFSQQAGRWYQGCHLKTSTNLEKQRLIQTSLSECSTKCRKDGFNFVAINLNFCFCIKEGNRYRSIEEERCNNNCMDTEDSTLTCGGVTNDTFSIYSTRGPFIESIQLLTHEVEPFVSVTLQLRLQMNKFVDILKEPFIKSKWDNTVELVWLTTFASGAVNFTAKSSQEQTACTLAFPTSGNFHIEISVRNLVSSIKSSFAIHAVSPKNEHTDIEFSLKDESHPSCKLLLPSIQDISRDGGNALVLSTARKPGAIVVAKSDRGLQGAAVLVNTSILLEIVLPGSNLKIDISSWNGTVWKKLSQKKSKETDACRTSSSCKIIQTFRPEKHGVFTINVKVNNAQGSRERNFTLVVLDFKDVFTNIVTDFSVVATQKVVNFNITVISARIINTSISLDFGEGANITATISEKYTLNKSLQTLSIPFKDGCSANFRLDHTFKSEGIFYPTVYVENDGSYVKFNFPRPFIASSLLSNIKLAFPPINPINESVQLTVTGLTSANVAISCVVLDELGIIYFNQASSVGTFILTFTKVGRYEINVTVSNLLSTQSAKSLISVQEPVGTLSLVCSRGPYILVEQELLCTTTADKGSDLEFYWNFQDSSMATDVVRTNHSSFAEHKYIYPGSFSVSVSVQNNISSVSKTLNYAVIVGFPIRCLSLISSSALQDQPVNITAVALGGTNVKFDVKFGSAKLLALGNTTVNGDKTIFSALLSFPIAGRHKVTMLAFDQFSNISRSSDVFIEAPPPDFSIHLLPTPLPPLKTLILRNTSGHTLLRDDLLYTFKFYDDDVRSTRVPVVSRELNLSLSSGVKVWQDCHGDRKNTIVQVTSTNQVGKTCRSLALLDNETGADRLEGQRQENRESKRKQRKPTLWHSTFVRSNEKTSFHSETRSHKITSLSVNYGKGGSPSNVTCSNGSCKWDRKFQVPGVFALDVSFYGRRPDRNDQSLRSVLVVEEPIKGLQLLGPTDVEIECEVSWRVSFQSGSHIVYIWTLDGVAGPPSTTDKFLTSFSKAGTHTLYVNVSNEFSSSETSISFQVKYPIVNASLSIAPTLLGNETRIDLTVQGGPDFTITCNYGDGQQKTFTNQFSTALDSAETESPAVGNPSRTFHFHWMHKYQNVGVYKVLVQVSNGISSVKRTDWASIEEPIGAVLLYTKTFQLPLSDELEVTAVVSSGKNLKFSWDFSDKYSKPTVISKGNTSTAKLFFSIPDKYDVSVTVTNTLQPVGIKASLPQSVDVIDKITKVSVNHVLLEPNADLSKLNTASLLQQANGQYATKNILFKARSNGSPVQFTFDFGDGSSVTVPGKEDPLFRDMMGEAEHVYTKENVYNVKLTAFNSLGNMTVGLYEGFSVQIPPTGLKLSWLNVSRNKTCIRLGEKLVVSAVIESGTNVSYWWSINDEKIDFTGQSIEHQFDKMGSVKLLVNVSNKVASIVKEQLYVVVQNLTGLTISVNASSIALNQYVDHLASVVPYTKDNLWYVWNITWIDSSNRTAQPTNFSIQTQDYKLRYAYMTSGMYVVVAKAYNCLLSYVVSDPISLMVVSPLESLSIDNVGDAVVNTSIRFIAKHWKGNFINYTWDFGDGTFVKNTRSSEVIHNYSVIGEYIVQLVAVNPVSSGTSIKKIFILNRPCNPPEVKILGNINPRTRTKLKFLQSEPVRWEAETKVNCTLATRVKYQWEVIDIDSKAVVDLKFPKLNHKVIKYLEYPMLYIPPWTLKDGKYQIKLKVEMSGTSIPVYTEVEKEISIISTSVVSTIFGGIYRHVGQNDVILLDGRKSYFPDNASMPLGYSWSCEPLQSSNYSCTETLQTRNASLHGPLLIFPANWLNTSISKEFIFKLKVFILDNDSEMAVSDQVIRVHPAKQAIDIHLECPQSWRNMINPGYKVSVRSHCQKCSEKFMTYRWEVYRLEETKDVVTDDSPGQCKLLNDSQTHQMKLGNRGSTINQSTTTTMKTIEQETSRLLKSHNSPVLLTEEKTKSRSKQASGDGGENEMQNADTKFPEPTEEKSPISRWQMNGDPIEEPPPPRAPVVAVDNQHPVEPDGKPVDPLLKPTIVNPLAKHMVSRAKLPIDIRHEDTLTGLDKPSLVIKPGVLKQGVVYLIELSVASIDGVTGFAMLYLEVNKSPQKGKCTIRPLKSSFNVFCSDWQDEHVPLLYEISYSQKKESQGDGDPEEPLVIYHGLRHEINIRIPRSSQHSGELNIAVLDRLGAKTLICYTPIPTEVRQTQDGTENPTDVHIDGMLNESLALLELSSRSVFEETSHDLFGPLTQLAIRLNELSLSGKPASEIRVNILRSLGDIPIRNEVEVTQALRCLVEITEETVELYKSELLTATTLLRDCVLQTESIVAATNISGNTRGLNPHILKLALRVVSNLLSGISAKHAADVARAIPQSILKSIIEDCLSAINNVIQLELQYHSLGERPLVVHDGVISLNASHYSIHDPGPLFVDGALFQLPVSLGRYLQRQPKENVPSDNSTNVSEGTTVLAYGYNNDQQCFQSRALSFSTNHSALLSQNNEVIHSDIASLEIYTCSGDDPVNVQHLPKDEFIHITIPRKEDIYQNVSSTRYYLDKTMVNIHQINASLPQVNYEVNDEDQADFLLPYLQLQIEFDPIPEGRSFPVMVIISSHRPPYNLKSYVFKKQYDRNTLDIKIPIPKGFYKGSQNYFITLVEASLNSGRRHSDEVKGRSYTLNVWWATCVYWNQTRDKWSSSGCQVMPTSSIEALHCSCSHLSFFAGYFELIPIDLSFDFVDEFFSLHENPVVVILVALVLLVYILLWAMLRQSDLHDIKKGNCVYLRDNTPSHKQTFEIIMETGLCRDAGTTSRISMILHGEEGMSETRELISDDNRPMFERNSRDRFIITLPGSLGKIYKIQLWHNNSGSSPGWFLRQVIVRDLSAGQAFFFLCQRWLAVDKEDGKVEREFTAVDGKNISFSLIFWCKGLQYLSDFHTWMSLWTCPAHSRFTRVQRLTVCFTLLLAYMCLNALWFQQSPPKIRGEFGLLDLSSHNIIVGAACCGIVIPLNLLLSFLFRRSKVLYPDYEEDKVLISVKSACDFPNDGEDEVQQPAVTYSILDQSVLNWQNIQDWAQKQWLKRQQSVRSSPNSVKTTQTNNQFSGLPIAPLVQQTLLAEAESDQASSGFEEATSQATPERHRIKATSEISSVGRKSKSVEHCDILTASRRLFLPFWCRSIAWLLCFLISSACATFTVLYGFRFGHTKSTMWIQSVYFSLMICLFIAQPALILVTVLYTAICHRHNPSVLDHYDDGFYGEKSMCDSLSKQFNHLPEPEEELLRGVAERSRSRYLRFAGPPQEKKLKSSRKKLIKQRRAITLIRDLWSFIFLFLLLMIIAFGKDTSAPYQMNTSLKHIFGSKFSTNSSSFLNLKSQLSWYKWSQTVFLDTLYSYVSVGSEPQSLDEKCAHIIGQVQLRQKRQCQRRSKHSNEEDCSYKTKHRLGNSERNSSGSFNLKFWGHVDWYEYSGYDLVQLDHSREDALNQLKKLKNENWITMSTQAVMVEMTLYNVANSLFSSVTLLLEVGPAGNIFTSMHIRSTYLFRYITLWDNCILACEMLYIVVTLWLFSQQIKHFIKLKKAYFYHFWNYIELLLSLVSTLYVTFYIYRFVLVSEAVEIMRSTFYEQFVNLQFLTLWDEFIRSLAGLVLFCVMLKILQVLRYHQIFWRLQTIYRRSKNELLLAATLYFGLIMAFSSMSTCLFGATVYSLRSFWSSIYTVSAVSVHAVNWPDVQLLGVNPGLDIVLFFTFTLTHGFILTYIFVVLTYKFKRTRNCHVLAMPACQLFSFYWEKLKWLGAQPESSSAEQSDNTLPPEFTMAEILYLVEELLFRMNALLGTSGLPDKRNSFTDSDSDHNAGDDGISSGASAEQNTPVTPNVIHEDTRLGHRVQKIEDKLCSNEPYLAQLLKLDSIGTDILSEEKEQELRSHLEFEIFRQLQMQRQEISMFNFQTNIACTLLEPSIPATKYGGLLSLGACSVPQDVALGPAESASHAVSLRAKDLNQTSSKTTPESYSSGQESPPEQSKEVCNQHHHMPVTFLPPKRSQSLKVPGKLASPNERSQKQWLDLSVSSHDAANESHSKAKLQRVASSSLIQKNPHLKPSDRREANSVDKKLNKGSLNYKEIPVVIKMNKEDEAANSGRDSRKQEPVQNLSLLTNAQSPGNVSPQSSESERGHKRTDSSSGQSGHERIDTSRIVLKRPELPPKPTFALRTSDTNKSHSSRSPKSKQYTIDCMASACPESSSGSEQEANLSSKRATQGRRNLRKTKSRGKGKGSEEGITAPLTLEADFTSTGETCSSNFDIIVHPVPSGFNPNDNTMPEELL